MPISQVALSNTFNEFRQSYNDAANSISGLTDGTGSANVSTIRITTLTAGRVPLITQNGELFDDSGLTFVANTNT